MVSRFETVADLLTNLGGISASRVCFDPFPGQATKRDLLRIIAERGRLHELVDGTLVEKAVGHPAAYISAEIAYCLVQYVDEHDLGFCTSASDLIEVSPNLVRGPSVSFKSWKRRSERTIALVQISKVIPDLAVEVLSPKNTRREFERKLKEYFLGGVVLVWIIDPRKRTAVIHTSPDEKTSIDESGTLDGGEVLPGFRLPLPRLFERLEKPKPKKRKK